MTCRSGLPISRSARVAGIATLLAACGGDAADLAAQLADDAGHMLVDAGHMLTDAAQVVDAAVPRADAAEPADEPLVVECSTVLQGSGRKFYYAVVEVPQAEIGQVWGCDPVTPNNCPAELCGAAVPYECTQTAGRYGNGQLVVECGDVADGGPDHHFQRVKIYR